MPPDTAPNWPSPTRRLFSRQPPNLNLPPQGPAGIALLGHRAYVGGLWEEIGQLQFDFLCAQGMRPEHRLLDIACGALRLGVHAIPYLAPGHYLGIDKEAGLVKAGLTRELPPGVAAEKSPRMLVNASFAFSRLGARADFAIAQSLFTHLPARLIARCLSRLAPVLAPGGRAYASFLEAAEPMTNPEMPHDHGAFVYTPAELAEIGRKAGLDAELIGDWGHPRGQSMMAFSAAG